MSAFTRSQTQIIYSYTPGALFEHDRYGTCIVTDIVCDPADEVNRDALFAAVYDVLRRWPDSVPERFPDPRQERDQYSVGIPRDVRFEPYPKVVECQRCGHIETLDRLRSLSATPQCTRQDCTGSFRQLPFVQIHNCGRIESLYVPSCNRHGRTGLVFNDTGRVATSSWRCRKCGNAIVQRPRMTPCGCKWSENANQWYQRFMRIVRTNDSSVFYSQTSSFINLDEDRLNSLRNDENATGLLLARIWGLLDDTAVAVAEERESARSSSESGNEVDPLIQAMIEELGPDSPAVQEYLSDKEKESQPAGQVAIDHVAEQIGQRGIAAPPSRHLLEHVVVLDTLRSWSIDDVIQMTERRQDELGSIALSEAERIAHEDMGFSEIRCLFDFPMALCSVGYTRYSSNPERATLRPFQAASTRGKAPIYVLSAETEAVMFQLNPIRLASWLRENGFVTEPKPKTTLAAWAWIRRNVPNLSAERWEEEAWNSPKAKVTRTILHTTSHLLLRHIEWSGFDPESVGEYVLPETLSFILYTNRYTEHTIGGLVTLFEQRLFEWLEATRTGGISCLYDPFCADEGGSCVGCLHRRYNCEYFNEDLSRAVLYGGRTPDGHQIRRGYWPV